MREAAQGGRARALATVVVLPLLLSFVVRRAFIGADRGARGLDRRRCRSARARRRLPAARISRRGARVRAHPRRPSSSARLFSQAGARLDDERLRRPALPSRPRRTSNATCCSPPACTSRAAAPRTASDDLDRPIRDQPGTRRSSGSARAPGSAAPPSSWPTSAGTRSSAPARSSPRRCPTTSVAAGVPARSSARAASRRPTEHERSCSSRIGCPYAPNRGDRIRAYHLHARDVAAFADVTLFSLVHDDDEAGARPMTCRSRATS